MIRSIRRAAVAAVLMVLLAPATARAQGVGIKGGLLYSTFSFDGISDVIDSDTGWMAGVFFGGNRDGIAGIMGEVNLLAKRGTEGDEDLTLYYVQVPVLLRLNGGSRSTGGVSVYGIVGPAVDLKIGDDLGDVAMVDEYEGFDVSIVGGAGIELGRFILEARGTWGLRNIAKDFEAAELKSRTFAILAGVRFN
jgi:hypothetical protein